MTRPQALTIAVEGSRVPGLLKVPRKARVCYVLTHGAGAGMLHPFMEAIAEGLAERGIATLRYQFPTWNRVESGQIRRNLPKLQCARQPPKRHACFQGLLSLRAANHLVAA